MFTNKPLFILTLIFLVSAVLMTYHIIDTGTPSDTLTLGFLITGCIAFLFAMLQKKLTKKQSKETKQRSWIYLLLVVTGSPLPLIMWLFYALSCGYSSTTEVMEKCRLLEPFGWSIPFVILALGLALFWITRKGFYKTQKVLLLLSFLLYFGSFLMLLMHEKVL